MSSPTRVLTSDKGGVDVNTSGSGKCGGARPGAKPKILLDAAGVPTLFEAVDQRPGRAPVPGRLSHLPVVHRPTSTMDAPPARPVSDTASPGPVAIAPGAGGVICRRCHGQLIGTELEYGLCGDCGDRWRRPLSLRNTVAA